MSRTSQNERVVEEMDRISSEDVLDQAYTWVCGRRHEAPSWHDVWSLRWRWADFRPTLRQQLLDGSFRLGPTRTVRTDDGTVEAWSARDAIVLKAVAIVLGQGLDGRVPHGCFSWTGNGGLKRAVRAVEAARPNHSFGTDDLHVNTNEKIMERSEMAILINATKAPVTVTINGREITLTSGSNNVPEGKLTRAAIAPWNGDMEIDESGASASIIFDQTGVYVSPKG